MTGGEKAAIGWRFISQTLFLVYCETASCAGVRVTRATVARRMEGITAEPQAHAGILREIMASLASGQLPVPQESSRMVFEKHPAPWIGRFFADLKRAELRNSTGGT